MKGKTVEGRGQLRKANSRHGHSLEGSNSAYDIRDVFPNLIRGLQAEQVEVAQQVVMKGQKLQVQLWQGQAVLACVQTMTEFWPAHNAC